MKAQAINAAKKEEKASPHLDAVLKPIYRREANNKFFNIDHEEGLYLGYLHELAQNAALRGEKYTGGSPEEQLGYFAGRYGVLLKVLQRLDELEKRRYVSRMARV